MIHKIAFFQENNLPNLVKMIINNIYGNRYSHLERLIK